MKTEKELNVILDVSANNVPTVDTLKNFIDTVAKFGYSAIYLNFADLFVMEGEPYFGYQRGRYTKEEINELDSFCKSVGVELRPMIQTLSQMYFVWKYSVYGNIMETKSVLLADEPKTYDFIEKMFATMREYISSNKIHIGMDDSYYVGRNRHLDLHGYEELSNVYLRHLNVVVEIAEKYGYECEFWSEPLTEDYFKKELSTETKEYVRENISTKLPEKASLCARNYFETDESKISELIDKNLKLGDKVSYTSVVLKAYGFSPDNAYSMRMIESGINACKKAGVGKFNVLCPSFMGGEQSVFCALPTLYFASERFFGREHDKKEFNDVIGVDFDTFMLLDLPNKPHQNVEYKEFNTKSFFYFYNDPLLGLLDKLLSENTGKSYGRVAKVLKEADGGKYGYIFETASALCKVLSNKAELGKNIKELYDKKDKKGLKRLVDEVIPVIITDVNEFFDCMENSWNKENKSFGFETQVQRIGGLIERLKTVSDRINEYCFGEVSSIPELESDRIQPDIKTNINKVDTITEDNYALCDWNFIVTVSFT